MTPIVQCTCLGNFGRFGNQLFQYAFARSYAEKYDATLEISNWIGQKIFNNVSHPKPSRELIKTKLDQVPFGKVNINLFGYFQNKNFYNIMNAKHIREWFTIKDEWKELYQEYKQFIVAHIRKGDYVTQYKNRYHYIDKDSFVRACECYKLEANKLVFLSEENPTKDNKCSKISYSNTIGLYGKSMYPDEGISFLPDFIKMINANTLLRTNSTFSFWAGFLRNDDNVFSPIVKNVHLNDDVHFIKGNYPALVHDKDNIFFGEDK